MPGGQLWAAVFFGLLAIAALSSTVSVFEVVVSHLVDRHRMTRRRACVITGIALFIGGVPAGPGGGTSLFGGSFESLTASVMGLSQLVRLRRLRRKQLATTAQRPRHRRVLRLAHWRRRTRAGVQGRHLVRKALLELGLAAEIRRAPAVIAVFLHATGLILTDSTGLLPKPL